MPKRATGGRMPDGPISLFTKGHEKGNCQCMGEMQYVLGTASPRFIYRDHCTVSTLSAPPFPHRPQHKPPQTTVTVHWIWNK